MPPNGQSLQETAAKGVEAIHQIVQDRDQLLKERDRMHTDLALQRERAEQLEGRLAAALAERDHYMRFSVELVTSFNNVRMVLDDAQRNARNAAYKPSAAPTHKKAESVPIDTGNLENLIKRLPVNGGDNADLAGK